MKLGEMKLGKMKLGEMKLGETKLGEMKLYESGARMKDEEVEKTLDWKYEREWD